MTQAPPPSELLRQNQLRAKKSWGQCFLGDPLILERIAAGCRLSPEDTVVELGAGLGHFTRALAATGANVVAIERDRDLLEILERDLRLPNVRLVAANAAKLDFAQVAGVPRPVVAGNLPYQLTSPILFELIAQQASVCRAVFLLQKEVAERLASPPGTRACGVLSVLLAAFATVELLFEVPARHFTPSPRVDSAVVRIEPFEPPRFVVHDWSIFTRLVKAAFSQRRKMLRGALKSDLALFQALPIEAALERAGVDATARAEQLSIEAFVALSNALVP
ncbi:MAG: 16S rRNA (adenine(1518)-N(6)/adenine(1519)-N(6))-dimethyltransferase RsmA [Myxococcales bacterium]|jgi:16S rRNA (adenine1518-N6/adenine1519-N6)-dimethyltransferase|nr:16S rRNA (adenine(1518)-N(6)/adenine(1519)-N(6))-dimethyltransferase RsmA [Myxococcales bacterium]